jgi:hypothetical protein
MKKFLTLFLGIAFAIQMKAQTETVVYYAIPDEIVGTQTLKANVNFKGDGEDWMGYEMTKTALTYKGNSIYSCTFTDKYNGLGRLQFQLYEGEAWKSQEEALTGWTSVDVYNHMMKVYDTDGWMSSPDVTYHAMGQPVELFGGSAVWTSDDSNKMNYVGDEGKFVFTKENVELTSNGVEFKVCKDGDFAVSYPNENYSLSYLIPEAGGNFDVEIKIDLATKAIEASVYKTATIGAAQYATFAFDGKTNYSAPEGLDGYIVKVEDSKINLYKIDGVAPEKTAVILKSEEAKAYRLYAYDMSTETADVSGNMLKVSDGTVLGDGSTIYALGNKSHGVGFYRVKSGVAIPAGKCYLENTSAEAKAVEFFGIDGETVVDGINELHNGQVVNAETFNLSGQRVDNSYKGIAVRNGRKIVVR